MNPIDIDAFVGYFRKLVGREFNTAGGKAKFVLQNISEHAFYYEVRDGKLLKQNIRYVQRVLEQYAKIQSLNPGHYSNITQTAPFILGLVEYYEKKMGSPKDN